MIRGLRHIAIRLWISALAGIPLSFIVLTYFRNPVSGKDSFAAAIIIFIIFFAAGYIMNTTGRKTILNLIKEAEKWERSGIYKKSEKNYLKALRIYDSFLLYPWKNKKITEKLTGAIAKFSLTCSIKNPGFDNAVTAFLSINSSDEDIALLYLEKLSKTKTLFMKDHEILSHFAEIYIDKPEMVMLMADIFINFSRIDFAARKIYKKALSLSDIRADTGAAIKELLGKEEKNLADHELSLEDQRYDKIPYENFNKDTSLHPERSGIHDIMDMVSCYCKTIIKTIIAVFKYTYIFLKNSIIFVKESENIKTSMKWATTAIVSTGMILFMISTFSRLIPEKTPGFDINKHKIENHIPVLYTIQVAAYLKKKYGSAYVTKLKSKGLDAYLSEAEGGGKKWFLVRISEFPDRKKALAYGKKLKQQGYINDFFVDNNSR